MTVYYNEFDPFAAAWLRELIKAGHIADGVVDERSIEDVCPSDLRGFTQCHFFAGIGVWSYALRRAGWGDDRPVWTGSCPCQPFSSAGAGAGFADERHLWPAFFHLIQECKPALVFGEQVASKDANPWIDLVQTDMEALGYAVGAVPFPSAGVGAPHIRDRTFWVGHTDFEGLEGLGRRHQATSGRLGATGPVTQAGEPLRMADASDERQHGRRAGQTRNGRYAARVELERLCDASRMADTGGERRQQDARSTPSDEDAHGVARWQQQQSNSNHKPASDEQIHGSRSTGPVNGFWRDADWLFCRDGKWRPVEPGTFPLAHGAPARVGRLRGYGNAINAVAAQAFIESVMEAA
jgi:DNA (cytosine-5)-methyltransferase 1